MRIGVTLPHMGPSANPQAVVEGAQLAERLGYDSVWAMDRLLYPTDPRNPFPGTPDKSPWPQSFKQTLDPLDALNFAAAHTTGIGLGTSVLDIPFYNPVVLARRLSTIDVLSGGRLRVGFGLGYSDDEYEATGTSAAVRGARADEFLKLLKAIWTTDPVEFQGAHFRLASSIIGPKPVQDPHPPIYLAAYAPAALRRAARFADGWLPNGIPVAELPGWIDRLRAMAAEEGRDPDSLQVVVVGAANVTPETQGEDRGPYTGSLAQVKDDISRTRDLGAVELVFELSLGRPTADVLAKMEQVRELVG